MEHGRGSTSRCAALLLALLATSSLRAQEHDGHDAVDEQRALPLPHARMGSGTSWLPDESPVHALHASFGAWRLMLHGMLSAGLNVQRGERGAAQLTTVSWLMGMASHPFLGGTTTGRLMMSVEPFTLPGDGYPLLLQTGESWRGRPLRDRQHPHDLFMELALLQQLPLGDDVALELYLAPAGEPAIGPTAFPHRPSASADPLAPLSHHWLDSTHITFGVLTAGLFSRRFKLEGSWFNGREPDDERYNLDLAVPDSYAARISVNPSQRWSLQASYAFLASPEGLHPDESVHRVTASAASSLRVGDEGSLASLLAFGANVGEGGEVSPALLVESTVDLDGKNVIYGRAEVISKSAEDLVVPGAPPDELFPVVGVAVGYQRALGRFVWLTPAVGVRASAGLVPPELKATYGTQVPFGAFAYLQLRPSTER